jgi:sensor domain CHASE-containing protein
MRRFVVAGWLAVLLFTVAAVIAEVSVWRRLQNAVEETKR